MSPAEIEKLKALWPAPRKGAPCYFTLASDAIPRLLEERERLLALAYAVAGSRPDWKGVSEVIAFATAPAGKEEK